MFLRRKKMIIIEKRLVASTTVVKSLTYRTSDILTINFQNGRGGGEVYNEISLMFFQRENT